MVTKRRDGQSHAIVRWPSRLLYVRGSRWVRRSRVAARSQTDEKLRSGLWRLDDHRQEYLIDAACLAHYFQGIAGRVKLCFS
jgi:hypothetical protein